jgi:hypothetical protein
MAYHAKKGFIAILYIKIAAAQKVATATSENDAAAQKQRSYSID